MTASSSTEFFQKNGFVRLTANLPEEFLTVLSTYTLYMADREFRRDDLAGGETHGVYGDTLAESLLGFYWEVIEAFTGMELLPSYSYYRVYRPGGELKRQKWGSTSEICLILCLGNGYGVKGKESSFWPLNLDLTNDELKPYVCKDLVPGEMLVIKSSEYEFWREKFRLGSWHSEMYFFYADRSKVGSEKIRFDGREGFGAAPMLTGANGLETLMEMSVEDQEKLSRLNSFSGYYDTLKDSR